MLTSGGCVALVLLQIVYKVDLLPTFKIGKIVILSYMHNTCITFILNYISSIHPFFNVLKNLFFFQKDENEKEKIQKSLQRF